MRVKLLGVLGKKFGTEYNFKGKSPRECISALVNMVDGFEKYAKSQNFNVWIDDNNIDAHQLMSDYTEHSVLCIGLHVTGAGGGGAWYIVAGIVIIALAWWNPAGWVAGTQMMVIGLGVGIAMIGVAQMMMPKATTTDQSDNRASYGFGEVNNTTEQGNCVPVLYGQGLIGGFIIMCRITTEDI